MATTIRKRNSALINTPPDPNEEVDATGAAKKKTPGPTVDTALDVMGDVTTIATADTAEGSGSGIGGAIGTIGGSFLGPAGSAIGGTLGRLVGGLIGKKQDRIDQANKRTRESQRETYGIDLMENLDPYGVDQFAEGGLVGSGDPTEDPKKPATRSFRSVTPGLQTEWNSYLDHLKSKGLAGQESLNSRPTDGSVPAWKQELSAWRTANPKAMLDESWVPDIQADLYNANETAKRRAAAKGQTAVLFHDPSKFDGWVGSKTSQQRYVPQEAVTVHNGQVTNVQNQGLVDSSGRATGAGGGAPTTRTYKPGDAGVTETEDGRYIAPDGSEIKQFAEGGMADPYAESMGAAAQAQQPDPMQDAQAPAALPQTRRINVQRGELLADTEGNVIDRFHNPNRFSPHAESQFKEPMGNFVEVPHDAVVIPRKFAKRFEDGDVLTRRSIMRRLVDQQVQNPQINEPQGASAEAPAQQFAAGGYTGAGDPDNPYLRRPVTRKPRLWQGPTATPIPPVQGTGALPFEKPGFINPADLPADANALIAADNQRAPVAHEPGADFVETGRQLMDESNGMAPGDTASMKMGDAPAAPGGRKPINWNMISRKVAGRLPGAMQMINAMQADTDLQPVMNHGYRDARANIMQTDDSYNVQDQIVAIDQSAAAALHGIEQNNTPSARSEAAAVVAQAAKAKGEVMGNAARYRGGVRNNMLSQLANVDVQQGSSNQAEQLRVQNETRMDHAQRENIMASAASENYKMLAGEQNDAEKIKMINAMSHFEDIDPLAVQPFMDDPHSRDYIYNELMKSRPLKDIVADLNGMKTQSATTRTTPKGTTTTTTTKAVPPKKTR